MPGEQRHEQELPAIAKTLGNKLDHPDEGHGFRRAENRRSFAAVAEAFLATHLRGRCEPIGDDFQGSTIEFRAGRELIPGLS